MAAIVKAEFVVQRDDRFAKPAIFIDPFEGAAEELEMHVAKSLGGKFQLFSLRRPERGAAFKTDDELVGYLGSAAPPATIVVDIGHTVWFAFTDHSGVQSSFAVEDVQFGTSVSKLKEMAGAAFSLGLQAVVMMDLLVPEAHKQQLGKFCMDAGSSKLKNDVFLDEVFFSIFNGSSETKLVIQINEAPVAPSASKKRARDADADADDEEARPKGKLIFHRLEIRPVLESARAFDQALASLRDSKGEFLAANVGDYARLPVHRLLPMSTRQRFKASKEDPGCIGVMLRERTKELLAFLAGKKKGVYLHGPQGVGKSHALYYAVCVLRADPRNRVIYINDCKNWAVASATGSYGYILKAVADAFHEDVEIIKTLPQFFESTPDEFLSLFESFLPRYCERNKLELFAVFDQHNGLTPGQRQQLPFSLPESLPEMWQSALCVVSASANNEYYLKIAADAQWPKMIFNRGFTDTEVASWCGANRLPSPEEEPMMNDVLLWTACVPLDLSLWLDEFEKVRLEERLAPYNAATASAWVQAIKKAIGLHKGNRTSTLNAQHLKFHREMLLPDLKSQNLAHDSYIVMSLELPAPPAVMLNQQLMYIEGDRIWPTTPLAALVLRGFWEPSAQAAIENTAQDVFKSVEFTNDTKGRVLEQYILRQLENSRFSTVGFSLPDCSSTDKSTTLQYRIGPFATRVFFGNSVPVDVDWAIPTLFIPNNSNYPCFDFLFWNGDCLLAVQITVALQQHKDITQEMHDKWRGALPAGKQNVLFLWIAPKGSDLTKKKKLQTPCAKFVCTLSQLAEHPAFPLLRHFRLLPNASK